MTTQIKITQLVDIGANLATTTVMPVVNMSGVPTTQKTNLGNVGNTILQGAGTTWKPAALANLAYTVANAAQPNITSTGTLSSLSVSGNTSLGSVANVKITGGTDGYVLQTDGAGNLSWTAQTGGGGNGAVGGANTQVQFNDAGSFAGNSGFTFNKTVGALAVTKLDTADVYHLNGVVVENSDLTHGATAALVLPANGNTTVPAQVNNTYGNVQITTGINAGALKNWVFDNTGNLNLPANTFAVKYANGTAVSIPTVGNIAVANFDGNASNVLHGDGTWSADQTNYGNSNVANYLPTFTGNLTANKLTVQQDVSGNGALRLQGIAGGNSTINIGGEADIDLSANVGNINLYTASNQPWVFDQYGVLHFPGDTIAADDIEGTGNFGFETPTGVGFGILTNAGDNEWKFGSDGNLTLPNNAKISISGNTTQFNTCPNGFLGLNSYDAGSNNIARVNISSIDELVSIGLSDPITEIDYNWTFDNTGNLTLPTNDFTINYANGTPVNIGGGSGNTGNVTFDNQIVIGTGDPYGGGGLYLAQGPDSVANLQYFRVRGGDIASHMHFDTGDNNTYDQYFGDDNKFLKLGLGVYGNVTIGTQNPGENLRWTFGNDGNTTVPGNIQSITTGFSFTSNISDIDTTSVANAVIVTLVTSSVFGGPFTGQVVISDVVGTTEANGTWYFEAVEANQFQLYYDQALDYPVDGAGWSAYVSGGLAVAAGYNNLSITGGNVSIINNSGNVWTFDSTGQLNIPEGSNSFDEGRIQSANGYPTLLGYGSSGEHGGPELDWMDSDDPANAFQDNTVLRNTMYINDNGLYVGMNENNKANVAVANWRFTPAGSTIFPTLTVDLHNGGTQNAQTLQFGDNSQQAVITGPTPQTGSGENAQRLIIQGQRGDTTGEGGDVYIWAGDADNYAGDIKIYAGDADSGSLGYGGYINISGGQGFNEGGYVNITGGRSTNSAGAGASVVGGIGATTGGSANLIGGQGAIGGNAYVQGGYGGGSGGNVNITGGVAGNGLAEYGNVNINSGASSWVFGNDGNLTLPGGGSVFSVNNTPSGNPGNTIILQPAGSGVTTNQQLLVYPTAGDGDHIHLTTGNLYQTELFVGNDNFYMKLANTGDVVLHANTGLSDATWTFGANSRTSLPGGTVLLDSSGLGLLTSGIANASIGTFVQGADGGVGWEYQGDGADANTSYGAVALDTAGTANTANLRFKVQLVADQSDASTNREWLFDTAGNLTLPTIPTGDGTDERSIISSQRKVIPPNRFSAAIDGATPTIVYTASQGSLSLKTTLVVQHAGFGLEMFDVSAVSAGANVIYSVSNRLNATGEADTTAVVDWADTQLAITLTVNSGATTSYVTYDSTEFGIAVD